MVRLLLRKLHLFDHTHQLVQARREDTLGLIHNVDGLTNAPELELNLDLGRSREGEDTEHAGHLVEVMIGVRGLVRVGARGGSC